MLQIFEQSLFLFQDEILRHLHRDPAGGDGGEGEEVQVPINSRKNIYCWIFFSGQRLKPRWSHISAY